LNLLVISHACAAADNRQLFAAIRERTGWRLTLVTPARWRDEFGNILDAPARPGSGLQLVKAPVFCNGNIILHFYRTDWPAFLGEGRFDAIYVHHEPYALATAQVAWANFIGPRIPLGFYSCQNIAKRYPPPFRWLESFVYRQSRFAFPVTDTVAGVLRGKGFDGEITVCPLPIDPRSYLPGPASRRPAALRRARGECILGYVGRLVPAKGLVTLASALGKLKDLNWKFALVGAGPFAPEFARLLEEQGVGDRLIDAGFVPHAEVPAYLSALDLLVVPSETQTNWKEQFGRVILEALACGTPVAGSDSGEIPNFLRRSGGGLIFPEKDPEALANVLRRMIQQPALGRDMAAAGRTWVLQNAALSTVAERIASALERAVSQRRAPLLSYCESHANSLPR